MRQDKIQVAGIRAVHTLTAEEASASLDGKAKLVNEKITLAILKDVQKHIELAVIPTEDGSSAEVTGELYVLSRTDAMLLKDMVTDAMGIMETFVERVEKGEVRSTKTYGAMRLWISKYTQEVEDDKADQ